MLRKWHYRWSPIFTTSRPTQVPESSLPPWWLLHWYRPYASSVSFRLSSFLSIPAWHLSLQAGYIPSHHPSQSPSQQSASYSISFLFFFTLVPCPSFLMSSPWIPPTHASANSFLCFCNCALWTWTPLCLRAALRSGFSPLHCWPRHSRHHLELLASSFSKDMCSRTFTCELKEKKTVYQEFGYFFFPDPWA